MDELWKHITGRSIETFPLISAQTHLSQWRQLIFSITSTRSRLTAILNGIGRLIFVWTKRDFPTLAREMRAVASILNPTREDMIEHPLFTPFTSETEKMSSTNLFSVSDVSAGPPIRARFLADAIPAESHAAGANAFDSRANIVNLRMDLESEDNGCMANVDKWPEKLNNTTPVWKHSAFKQIGYFFTYKLYDYFVKGE